MGSARLPGKVMAEIAGRPLLAFLLARLKQTSCDCQLVTATTEKREDDIVEQCASDLGVPVLRGPEDDVLTRFMLALRRWPADIVVRVTADNPFTDPHEMDALVEMMLEGGYDYARAEGLPLGSAVDCFSGAALERLDKLATTRRQREHINAYILDHPEQFRTAVLEAAPNLCRPDVRVTVDTPEDLAVIRCLVEQTDFPEDLSLEEVIARYDQLAIL